jgi:hypothetical protein
MSSGQTLGQAKYNRTIAGSPPSANVNWTPAGQLKVYIDPSVKKEKKKMGWFKRKFAQWTREAWESAEKAEVYATDSVRLQEGLNGKSSVRFTIYPASGGFIIEHYKQERYKDSDGPLLTIVNSGDDLGKAVEHILAIEALRA